MELRAEDGVPPDLRLVLERELLQLRAEEGQLLRHLGGRGAAHGLAGGAVRLLCCGLRGCCGWRGVVGGGVL